MVELSTRVGRIRTDSIVHTIRAIIATAVVAATIPYLLVFLGWQWATRGDGELVRALGVAVAETASYWGLLAFTRQLCSSAGVVKSHFGWREQLRAEIWRALPVLMAIALPGMPVDECGRV